MLHVLALGALGAAGLVELSPAGPQPGSPEEVAPLSSNLSCYISEVMPIPQAHCETCMWV